jgi:hypothetical protein
MQPTSALAKAGSPSSAPFAPPVLRSPKGGDAGSRPYGLADPLLLQILADFGTPIIPVFAFAFENNGCPEKLPEKLPPEKLPWWLSVSPSTIPAVL